MARPWRIEFEGAYYHVLSRGNERRDIFYDDKDRKMYLDMLGETTRRFEGRSLVPGTLQKHIGGERCLCRGVILLYSQESIEGKDSEASD